MKYCVIILSFIYCFLPKQLYAQVDDNQIFFILQKNMNDFFDQKGKVGTGYKQWKRAEYYLRNRLSPEGKIVNATLLAEKAKALLLPTITPDNVVSVSAAWTFVGPDSVSGTNDHGKGRVNRLAFDAANPAIVYAATSGGGLWKTTNYGVSWLPLTDGLGNLSIGGVAVDPANSNTIYILTGDGDAMTAWNNILIGTGRFCSGIYKSTNGGTNWQKLTNFIINENAKIFSNKLAVNPKDPSRIYACTSNGIYMSFDGGNTWPESRHLLAGQNVFNIQFAPGTKDTVYASGLRRIYKSVNGGISFNAGIINNGGTPVENTPVQIAVTPINSSYVFAINYLEANPNKFHKVYRSSDYGETYDLINQADSTTDYQIWGHMSIAVNPLSASFFAFSGRDIYYTSNQGSTYRKSPNAADNTYHVDVHELAYAPDGKLYAATDGGVYMSTNNGATFTYRSGGLCVSQYYGLDILKSNPNTIIAGAQDNSTHFKDVSGGVFNWKIGGDGLDCAINQTNSSIIYGSYQNGVFLKSVDGGVIFTAFKSPSATDTSSWRVPIKLDPNDQNIVFVGYQPISKYNGTTWSKLQAGVSGRTDLEIAKDNSSVIYAMDNTYNFAYDGSIPVSVLFRSVNGGTSFTNITPLLVTSNHLQITDVTLNPADNAEAWISIGGFNALYKLFRTVDGGITWQNLTINLPNVPVNCILYQPNFPSVTGAVYIGTDIGVFYGNDNMANWVYFSNNLPGAEVMDLELSNVGFLYAATYGRGIWRVLQYNNICQSSYVLSPANTNSQFSYRYSASNYISSAASHNGPDKNVVYKADNYVNLTPGFTADATNNTLFAAIIGSCQSSDPFTVVRQTDSVTAGIKTNIIIKKQRENILVTDIKSNMPIHNRQKEKTEKSAIKKAEK